MRFRVPEIVLGAFLTVAVFAVGVLFSSGHRPINDGPKQHSTEQSAQKIAEHSAKTESLWVPTDSVGLYTLVLAVFTGLLVGVSGIQGYFLLRADKTARIAANAADLNARASIALALPIIAATTPELLEVDHAIADGEPYAGSPILGLPNKFSMIPTIKFENEGQTPAYPAGLEIEWRIGAKPWEGTPHVRTYDYSTMALTKGGEAWNPTIHFGIEIPDSERSILEQDGNFLWLRVDLTYLDFLKEERNVIYRWRWDNPGPGGGMYFFESDGTPDTEDG
jgi:hypothetical protein